MPNRAPSNLEDHLGYWLRRLSNGVSQAFAERLARHEISVPQWVVLRLVFDHAGISLKDLAIKVGVDLGALSRMVERLVSHGLLTRNPKPGNRREVEIELTRTGRALVPNLAREADENDEAFFRPLSATQRDSLLKTIKLLLEANQLSGPGQPLH
jgi:DNA-binding MarR family transcriptional regulator